ncbi:hypothetical protein ACET3Z_009555 [Daucus carota]
MEGSRKQEDARIGSAFHLRYLDQNSGIFSIMLHFLLMASGLYFFVGKDALRTCKTEVTEIDDLSSKAIIGLLEANQGDRWILT